MRGRARGFLNRGDGGASIAWTGMVIVGGKRQKNNCQYNLTTAQLNLSNSGRNDFKLSVQDGIFFSCTAIFTRIYF